MTGEKTVAELSRELDIDVIQNWKRCAEAGATTAVENYNTPAPHSALAIRSPTEYRAEATLSPSR